MALRGPLRRTGAQSRWLLSQSVYMYILRKSDFECTMFEWLLRYANSLLTRKEKKERFHSVWLSRIQHTQNLMRENKETKEGKQTNNTGWI